MNESRSTSILNVSIQESPLSTNSPTISTVCWLLAFTMLFGLSTPVCILLTTADLRTPFVCYVLNILMGEAVLSIYVVLFALDVGYGPPGVGTLFCPFVDFLFDFGTAVTVYSELAISVTRTWALFYPLHFRGHHSKILAKRICWAIWICNAVFLLPYGVISYEQVHHYKVSFKNCVGLSPNLQPIFTKVIVLFLLIPPTSIVLMYPVLYRKYSSLHKVHTELIARYRIRPVSSDPTVQLNSGAQRWSRNEHEGFLILTWIVVCVVVFWAPSVVFQILRQISRTPAAQALTEARCVLIWSLLHVCVEPYLFILTIRPLRQKVEILISSYRSHHWNKLCFSISNN